MQAVDIYAADQAVARQVAETLDKHYPGHAWAVQASIEQGIVTVRNLNLSGEMGFIMHMDDLLHDPSMKHTIRAGGELLERYNLRRGSFKASDLDGREVDLRGNLKYDS